MNITKKDLILFRNRIDEICRIKYNRSYNSFSISEEGYIEVTIGGRYEDEDYEITIEELSKDLDLIRAERIEKERLDKIEFDRKFKKWKENDEKYRKAQRRAEYEKLKKEFEI